jgi:hypothetical protein
MNRFRFSASMHRDILPDIQVGQVWRHKDQSYHRLEIIKWDCFNGLGNVWTCLRKTGPRDRSTVHYHDNNIYAEFYWDATVPLIDW